MTKIFYRLLKISLLVIAAVGAQSCIEDGVETSPSAQPVFSVDTLRVSDAFTAEPTPTQRFVVYNRHGKILNISSIGFRNPDQTTFRVNVDGRSGSSFSNVEIRPNDSIFVFVEATVAPTADWLPVEIEEHLDFSVNGRSSSVVLAASASNVERLTGAVITRDTIWSGDHRRQIFDSLVVAPGVTLTIGPGARLYFHDAAFLKVGGTLNVEGTPDAPVDFCGDRRGFVAADIPFDLMASQWQGILFAPGSRNNRMEFATVRNTVGGVVVDSLASPDPAAVDLELINCRLRNSAGYALDVRHSSLRAVGCELADASSGVLRLTGGRHEIAYTTIANYYLFTALGGPSVQLYHLGAIDEEVAGDDNGATDAPLMSARFTNSIVYGNGSPVNCGDLTGTDVIFRNCLIKGAGTDDDNFIDLMWDADPLYYTDRAAYLFDYRLQAGSPALFSADPSLTPAPPATDAAGTPRPSPASLGAYEERAE